MIDKLISKHNDFSIWQIPEHDLMECLKFVLESNFTIHSHSISPNEFNKTLQDIYEYELKYFQYSIFYKITDNTGIIGTMRIKKWNPFNPFPLPDYIYLNNLNEKINSIWHVGRFAIKSNIETLSKGKIIKTMLMQALEEIFKDKANLLIAECDLKLLKTLHLLKLGVKDIGNREFILGSETTNIIASYNDILPFYEENSKLKECLSI